MLRWFLRIVMTLFIGACLSVPVSASWRYWTEGKEAPQYIVLGKIVELTANEYERKGHEWKEVGEIIQIFDSGIVEVEEILHGENVPAKVPVSWMARLRVAPPNEERHVTSANERDYVVGDRRIWVLWSKPDDPDSPHGLYHHCRDYSVDTREKVISEISEYFGK